MLSIAAETRMIEAGGLRFETLVAGAGNPKLAILLHGFPEAHVSWRAQIPFLAAHGYEVLAPNQRGYGASSRPGGIEAYHVDRLVDDVAALIDVAGQGRPVTLVGHDWGAIVAWVAAIRAVRPLERLICMNVPHPAVFAEAAPTPAQRRRSWYIAFFQLPFLPEWLMGLNRASAVGQAFLRLSRDRSRFPPELLDVYRDQAAQPGALTAMINWYRAAVRLGAFAPYLRGVARRIDTPTLLVWGEEDDALGIELTEGYDGLVSDFTLRRLPGVSHWVQQEAPEAVNAILAEWLALAEPAA